MFSNLKKDFFFFFLEPPINHVHNQPPSLTATSVARSFYGGVRCTHVDAGCWRVELVLGKHGGGRGGGPRGRTLVQQDAAGGQAVLPQVPVGRREETA